MDNAELTNRIQKALSEVRRSSESERKARPELEKRAGSSGRTSLSAESEAIPILCDHTVLMDGILVYCSLATGHDGKHHFWAPKQKR